MAEGARRRGASTYALSTTGYAGRMAERRTTRWARFTWASLARKVRECSRPVRARSLPHAHSGYAGRLRSAAQDLAEGHLMPPPFECGECLLARV